MPSYNDFFLNSTIDVAELETFEISHPNFTKVYRVVRNCVGGLTAKLETGATTTFDYYPVDIVSSSSTNDLDQKMTITMGDLGQVLPIEFDSVATADGFRTKPTVLYRLYRSDDLSGPMLGPFTMEVVTFSFKRQGCTFEAQAPSLNLSQTGESYSIARFPMLAGFV